MSKNSFQIFWGNSEHDQKILSTVMMFLNGLHYTFVRVT